MNDHDKPRFVEALTECAAVYGETLTPERIASYWRLLSRMSVEAVATAIDTHMLDPDRGRFFPRPSDLIAAMQRSFDDGRPSPDEAWAIALTAEDENETVVWTDEISGAWGLARPVLAIGDKVGARQAFIEAYRRMVAQARGEGRKPVWRVSPGRDAQRRHVAIEEAVAAGRLSARAARALFPTTKDVETTASTTARIAQMPRNLDAEARIARKRLAQLRDMIFASK